MKTYKEEKRRVKRCIIIYQSKKEVNEQIEKKIKKNESECMWEQELFQKKVCEVNNGQMENCNRTVRVAVNE